MNEITLINLLNKICEQNTRLNWKLNCKYPDEEVCIMQLSLFERTQNLRKGEITFKLDTGQVITGKHSGLVAFSQSTSLVDALLEILHYEVATSIPSYN